MIIDNVNIHVTPLESAQQLNIRLVHTKPVFLHTIQLPALLFNYSCTHSVAENVFAPKKKNL